jgi:hypothetical protein
MQTVASFDETKGMDEARGRFSGTPANSARLRENLRDSLEQLAVAAGDVLRRSSGTAPGMAAALSMARVRFEAYCDHLGRELEPRVARRSAFGAVLSGHLRRFRARLQRELDGIEELLYRTPHGDGVAHAVHVTALVMLADIDAHARDLELIELPPCAA